MPVSALGGPSKKIGHQAQPGSVHLRNIGHWAYLGACFAGGHWAARCPVLALQ